MEVRSGSDVIKMAEPSLAELKNIPVGKCMHYSHNGKVADATLKGEVTYCRISENEWKLKTKLTLDDEELGDFESKITIEED